MKEIHSHITIELERDGEPCEVIVYYTATRHWQDEDTDIDLGDAKCEGEAFELSEAERALALETAKDQVDDDWQDQLDDEGDFRYDLAREREDF